ncbi:hypothetical protein BLOT_011403 [Blomia tropicalis]|nr:hypothetical protein BLOT_011403 [Blomia tropicalis]
MFRIEWNLFIIFVFFELGIGSRHQNHPTKKPENHHEESGKHVNDYDKNNVQDLFEAKQIVYGIGLSKTRLITLIGPFADFPNFNQIYVYDQPTNVLTNTGYGHNRKIKITLADGVLFEKRWPLLHRKIEKRKISNIILVTQNGMDYLLLFEDRTAYGFVFCIDKPKIFSLGTAYNSWMTAGSNNFNLDTLALISSRDELMFYYHDENIQSIVNSNSNIKTNVLFLFGRQQLMKNVTDGPLQPTGDQFVICGHTSRFTKQKPGSCIGRENKPNWTKFTHGFDDGQVLILFSSGNQRVYYLESAAFTTVMHFNSPIETGQIGLKSFFQAGYSRRWKPRSTEQPEQPLTTEFPVIAIVSIGVVLLCLFLIFFPFMCWLCACKKRKNLTQQQQKQQQQPVNSQTKQPAILIVANRSSQQQQQQEQPGSGIGSSNIQSNQASSSPSSRGQNKSNVRSQRGKSKSRSNAKSRGRKSSSKLRPSKKA